MNMHCVSKGLAVAGFLVGVAGAWFWLQSARVAFRWPPVGPLGSIDPNDPMDREPVLSELKPGWYAYRRRGATQVIADATERGGTSWSMRIGGWPV